MSTFKTTALALLLSGLTLQATAAIKPASYGETYQPVAQVVSEQAQVVFYRDSADQRTGSANVYLDGEFQAALLPGGFNVFCVAPGSHSLGAFVKDAPLYEGKRTQPYKAQLESGKTYFMKIDNSSNGMPSVEQRQAAEQQLRGKLRNQIHTISRASAVEACRYTGPTRKDYQLSSDVLCGFGKSSTRDLTPAGREAIQQMVDRIRRENSELNKLEVIGHTDPIGSVAGNQALGQRRAATVRLLMIEAGIPARAITASSVGSSDLLVNACSGSRAQQIECNIPNRRVEIRVSGGDTQ